MTTTQKESVFEATMVVLEENNIKLDGQPIKDVANKVIKDTVVGLVTDSIINGATQFSPEAQAKHNTVELVRKYVSGMVDNWWRKDLRLNGGLKYETKNPGARAGQGDAELTNLKNLLQLKQGDAEACKLIQQAIDNRKAELTAAKAKKLEVDASKIPEHLRHLLG